MGETIFNDEPEDTCFGCGQRNESGLRMVFQVQDDGSVLSEYTVPESRAGAPGVVHGGIQAAMLDEVMGMAAHVGGERQGVEDAEALEVVTADFQLRYRAPAPTETALHVRGRLLRIEGRAYHCEGEIVLASEARDPDASARPLTRATSRWVRIDQR